MYISELKLKNFRGFKNSNPILFNEDINIIIGPNNGGKTTILRAMGLIFGNDKKRLEIDDFYKNVNIEQLKNKSPKIEISAKFKESNNEEEFSEDIVAVSTWLTKIKKPYEALITYEFFLPEQYEEEYIETLNKIDSKEIDRFWEEIKHKFLRKYVYKLFVGNPKHQNVVDRDSIKQFDFQFLDAIRDVERDLISGKNALLREVIDFFMDYDIKSDKNITDKEEKINERKENFSIESQKLIGELQKRMKKGKVEMLRYAEETGVLFDNLKPSFEGKILDTELYSALRLIVENETRMKLPAKNNGLGYNNLIYISLLLAKMQKDASIDYLGSNAKIYSILAIEEPEAHLHPDMQYKFLKFLYNNEKNESKQIFITSHSPNITAAVPLDNIIILYKYNDEILASYPGKVFDEANSNDLKSKKYIERFLDVTKADMLFANSLILVEGISEQLVLPEIAKIKGYDFSDTHTSVINIGGRFFNDFIKLFSNPIYGIKKKVACVTDLDPSKKSHESRNWKKCYPYELFVDSEFSYKECDNPFLGNWSYINPIKVYKQEKFGCTFEYELFLKNIKNENIITSSVKNREELLEIIKLYKNDESIEKIIKKIKKSKFKENIEKTYSKSKLEGNDLKKHIIATRYLYSIENDKGIIAQELAEVISDEKNGIKPPKYFSDVIEWICTK